MEKFIGTKIIKARPDLITYKEYCEIRGWDCLEERENELGYMVGYPDANGDFSGSMAGNCDYISWSPKDVFDAAYKPETGMPFGLAIEAMKKGYKVAREGWNGKGMFVVYQKGYPDGIKVNKQTAEAYGVEEGTLMKFRPYMQLKTAQNDCAMWAPSGSDSLAEDWQIVE